MLQTSIVGRLKRWRYKRAMFKAIKEAMTDVFPYVNKYGSRSDALRVLKRFEKVNGFKFNPFNKNHVFMIAGCARHENFFRGITK